MNESHEGAIRITMVSRNASGTYRCEVSTENTFRTLSSEKKILVVNSGLRNIYSSTKVLIFFFFVYLIAGNHQLFVNKL